MEEGVGLGGEGVRYRGGEGYNVSLGGLGNANGSSRAPGVLGEMKAAFVKGYEHGTEAVKKWE